MDNSQAVSEMSPEELFKQKGKAVLLIETTKGFLTIPNVRYEEYKKFVKQIEEGIRLHLNSANVSDADEDTIVVLPVASIKSLALLFNWTTIEGILWQRPTRM